MEEDVESETKGDDNSYSINTIRSAEDVKSLNSVLNDVDRLERLYVKLWLCLRWAVFKAFTEHNDVLDAGSAVQVSSLLYYVLLLFTLTVLLVAQDMLHTLMKTALAYDENISQPNNAQISRLWNTTLSNTEQLHVHMDCMNALGQIVKIEDVDDMGGQCWTYIRISINNISLESSNNSTVVAIGDTFVFSSSFSSIFNATSQLPSNKILQSLDEYGYIQDSYCLTHAISPCRYYLAAGIEETMAKMLVSGTRNLHL